MRTKLCWSSLSRIGIFCLTLLAVTTLNAQETRRIKVSDWRDRMQAGWVGQMAGVAWGAPTEFKFNDVLVPEDKVPEWTPDMINHSFGQDDIYVEMTFLKTLEDYGFDCTWKQAGIDFANSQYDLWCANFAARNNLRTGIAPPDSGHPKFTTCPNDIDYQIEADFAGLIAPGMPNTVIALGDKFGRIMNYSDGLYGGIFMGGMYAEAFFTDDLHRIINAGLACIPAESQYAEMVRDLVAWHKQNPDQWQATWQLCKEKYRENPEYQKCSNGGIDVKINGACVLLGLLYGQGDMDQTIIISMRAGYDSDCNPSSAAGVLATAMGFQNLPKKFTEQLSQETVFSFTAYNFPQLLAVCEKLTRDAITRAGGSVEVDADGNEVFVIPVKQPEPPAYVASWEPGPVAESRYTEEEMKSIQFQPEEKK